MKSIISILLFITLPLSIYGEETSKNYPNEVALLNEMARTQSNINDELHLKEDGFVADAGTGFVYEGIYIFEEHRHSNGRDEIVKSNKAVAIIFVPDCNSSRLKKELKMLTYLKAYQAPDVEKYGIQTVYYHGKWGNFTLAAATMVDVDLPDIVNLGKLKNPIDVLILMRNFIVQLKYMHSCGVRHDDIKPENIMIRGHKSFLMDFSTSSKMMKKNAFTGTIEFGARRLHQKKRRLAIDDLESFFYAICHVLGCQFEWFGVSGDLNEILQITGDLKLQTDDILNRIDRCVSDKVLKMVIHAFAKEIYANATKPFPDYDRLYELVNGKIAKLHGEDSTLPAMFSWLTHTQKVEAAHEIHSQPPLNINDIVEPKSIDFTSFVYPAVEHLKNIT